MAPFPFLASIALLLAATLGPAAVPGLAQQLGEDGIPPGTTVPPALVETLDGQPVDLVALVGEKPVLVEFWATWCVICRALEPRVRAAHERFGDRVEFVIVAVAVGQDRPAVRRHRERHALPGRVLWDARGAAVRAFEAPGTGAVFVLDREGKVAYAGTGADQDIEAALEAALQVSAP